MKVVGSDAGNYEHEEWVESVVIAPAERYVVHVQFDTTGDVALVNRVRGLDHLFGRFFAETDTLGVVHVGGTRATPDLRGAFATLRRDTAATADIERYRKYFDRAGRSLAPSHDRNARPSIREPAAHAAGFVVLRAGRMDGNDADDELGLDRGMRCDGWFATGYGQGEHGYRLALPPWRRRQAAHSPTSVGRCMPCSIPFTSTVSDFSSSP